MNKLESFVFKQFAGRALKRPCPARIPRSGDAGRAINCFTLSIEAPGEPVWMVESLDLGAINCFRIEDNNERKTSIFRAQDVDPSDLRIAHFDGLAEIRFIGLWDYVIGRTTFWPYLRLLADRAGQWFFNKRPLNSAQQTTVLAALLESVDAPPWDKGLSKFAVSQLLAGRRYWLHPDAGSFRARVDLYLDSFEKRGWAQKVDWGGIKYVITGEGMAELERREEDDRKHRANARLQWALWFVALMSAGSAAVQANIVKIPTLLDWSGSSNSRPDVRREVAQGKKHPPAAGASSAVSAPSAASEAPKPPASKGAPNPTRSAISG